MNAPITIANSLRGRTHYTSSGGVNVGAFLAWALLALAVASLLAAGMFWLYHVGHYYIIIVPFLCALAVAGMAQLTVIKGHCRSRIVAALTGAFLGLSLYLGSYYIGMVYYFGPEVATRPDALFQYIRFRLATDVVRDVNAPKDREDQPGRGSGSRGMNWFRFGMEIIGVVAIVTAAAYRRSRKSYCEQCRRWLRRETTTFEPDKAAQLLESLQTGSARSLAAICAAPPFTSIPNTTLAVDCCPSLKEGRSRDCPVYVSLKSVTTGPKGAAFDSFEQSKGKLLERYVQLNPDELPALAPRFPAFETYAGRAAVASLLPKPEMRDPEEEVKGEGVFAEISSLGSEHTGKVMTRKRLLFCSAFGIAGLLGFIGGLGLVAWGASLLEGKDPTAAARMGGIALCAAGGVLVLSALSGMFFDLSFGGNRWLRKAFRAELARRAGLLVDAHDPDARFVEVVPKLNWGKMMLDNASDIGLLIVDRARRELRLEGDKERWRIPGGSITHCEVEKYVQGHGEGAVKMFYVVLRATRRDGFWEAPIRERSAFGLLSSRKRRKLADQLAAAIQGIRDSAGSQAEAVGRR